MTRLALLLLACAGCFGDGPTPEVPLGASLVFYVPPVVHVDDCSASATRYRPYIADVAIGNGSVQLALDQWNPPNGCNDGGGGNPPTYDVPIYKMPLDTVGATTDCAAAGTCTAYTAGTTHSVLSTRVAANDGVTAWAWNSDDGNGLQINGDPALGLNLGTAGLAYPLPSGFVAGVGYGYVVMTNNQSNGVTNFFSPSFPCCGSMGGSSGDASSAGWRIRWDDASMNVALPLGAEDAVYADTLKSGLIMNPEKLFFAARRTTTDPVLIKSLEKQTLDGLTTHATISAQDGVLVGMDANGQYLVYATAPSYRDSIPSPSCTIHRIDFATGTDTVIMNRSDFSCLDAAFDGAAIYFTIIDAPDNSNDGTPGAYGLYGIGLGRVSVDGGEPETVRHGIDTLFEGPRRVYLDGDEMYLVDSFSIVRAPKAVLDGMHDF